MSGSCSVIRAVEAEFGEPFWDVVRGLAEQGCSRREAAAVLGYCSDVSFRRLLSRHPEQVIPWPPRNSSALFREAGKARAAKALAARNRNQRTLSYDGILDSLAGHARRAGLNPHAVYARLRAGWTLDRALSTPRLTKPQIGSRHGSRTPGRAHYWARFGVLRRADA